MTLRRPLATSLTVLAALTLTGAGWSWWSALSARAPFGDLESQVAGLRQEVGHLGALPDLPPLPPLTDTLRNFLGSVQPPWAVKFAGPPDQEPNAFKPVPNMAGVRVVVLEVTDPKPAADLPQVGLAALARWQGRCWPSGRSLRRLRLRPSPQFVPRGRADPLSAGIPGGGGSGAKYVGRVRVAVSSGLGGTSGGAVALLQQLAAMGWDLAKKERESRLAELEAKQTELRAKSKEGEARFEEAEAWIHAIRKNPRLVLRSTPGIEGKASGGLPFEVPPPPPSFPHASGPLVVPPKPVGPPAVPPERSPTASEIFVRMIDGSGPVPEAMVSVGPASYVVRAGDPIGAWQVAAIGPNGIWIKAGPSERVWRPLLARGSIPAEPSRPSSGVPAAPPAAASP